MSMATPEEMDALKEKAPKAAEFLRLLGNPNRLLILCHVTQSEKSVTQLEQDLGIRQPALSQRLAELRQSGLVKTRKDSRSVYYSIADAQTQAVMAMLYEIFCGDATKVGERPRPRAPETRPSRGDAARFARIVTKD